MAQLKALSCRYQVERYLLPDLLDALFLDFCLPNPSEDTVLFISRCIKAVPLLVILAGPRTWAFSSFSCAPAVFAPCDELKILLFASVIAMRHIFHDVRVLRNRYSAYWTSSSCCCFSSSRAASSKVTLLRAAWGAIQLRLPFSSRLVSGSPGFSAAARTRCTNRRSRPFVLVFLPS